MIQKYNYIFVRQNISQDLNEKLIATLLTNIYALFDKGEDRGSVI